MPDTITTKPFRSQAQWRMAFARGLPFARRWAHETPGGKKRRFQQLPVKITKKAPNYGARAGQTIAGRLRRGASGKFESASGPGAQALNAARDAARQRKPGRVPTARRGGGRKPARTEQQRAQERTQRQTERQQAQLAERDRILSAAGLDDQTRDALVDARAGDVLAPVNGEKLAALGLAEQAQDGAYRLTAAGREVVNAANRGDAGRVRDTMSRARDRQAARNERQAAGISRAMQRAATPKPPEGGGGGQKKKPPKAARAIPRRSSRAPARAPAGSTPEPRDQTPALPRNLVDAARALSSGQATDVELLIRNGLAKRDKQGRVTLTAAGLRAIREKSAAAFTVYKDAAGRYRWVAYSSNAYRDRDREIVSTKALEEDCHRADNDGQYGPLRWWHVGGPVGKGWDLGTCDFNAMHGRVLVESGTFKSAAIGAAVARAAPHLQLSIGFTHAPDEPDRQGVFHHIRRFERSLVPSGRAANPFTRLIVKETRMDSEKEAALKATLGDAAAAEVLAGAEATQKDADAQGIAYKADDPWAAVLTALKGAVAAMVAPPAEPTPDPVTTEKAEPEAKADGMGMGGGDMMAEEEVVEPAGEDPGEMTYDEFVSEIRRVVREEIAAELKAQIAPLAGMLDIEKKVSGAVQSLMQPYAAQQATKDDARTQEIESLKARIAELEGDVPNVFRQPFVGYRPSQAADTVVTKDQAPGGAPPPLNPAQPTADDPFADIKAGLFGAAALNGHTPGV